MRTIIIEDEYPAAERLCELIRLVAPEITVSAILGSVSAAKSWLGRHPAPDLIFSDIQLSDGLAFEALETVAAKTAIVFTTSYDQYAIRAFKLNSMDYLLKPIKQTDLRTALDKYKTLKAESPLQEDIARLQSLMEAFQPVPAKQYKDRFLVRHQERLITVGCQEIAYFYTANEMVMLQKKDGQQFLIEHSMEELETLLDPKIFFRLNRQLIAHLEAIKKICLHFNKRLKIEMTPPLKEEIIVSKEKTPAFKRWLEGKT
ncbi:MAG: LytTR family DNA-binding domain-containing protein [Cytophagales bacterium]|jgi:DNA-binding LytR/AlgR family response regulator|nr:LytTR family DNA-binding domain-containing protein [Cytophagales bacterium]